jgi:SAM-dependent methyltransferase
LKRVRILDQGAPVFCLGSRYFYRPSPSSQEFQDAFILSELGNASGKRIAEIGGGHSRVLPYLAKTNECWNIDPFEGAGKGPTDVKDDSDIKLVRDEVGSFSENLPNDYFDMVISISVVEHLATEALADFFRDIARILAPGGKTIHAIDAYLGESEVGAGIDRYKDAVDAACDELKPIGSNESLSAARFHPSMVTDPDINMWKRNKLVPALAPKRNVAQCVSLCAGWEL